MSIYIQYIRVLYEYLYVLYVYTYACEDSRIVSHEKQNIVMFHGLESS